MNKILGLLFGFLFTIIPANCADMRFIQVESAMYNNASSENFEQLVEKINKEKDVEFIVFTGNNISNPDNTELINFLAKAKKLNKPYYLILGQKDVNKKNGLGKREYMELVHKRVKAHSKINSPNYVFVKRGLVFIVADGSKEFIPTASGYYKDDVILWLDEQLDDYREKNVVILQHYPIISPCRRETHYTYGADKYLKLLSEHKNVKAVVSGHFNTNAEQSVAGILHISTKNAPTYRIIDILDYDTDNPTFWSTIKE